MDKEDKPLWKKKEKIVRELKRKLINELEEIRDYLDDMKVTVREGRYSLYKDRVDNAVQDLFETKKLIDEYRIKFRNLSEEEDES